MSDMEDGVDSVELADLVAKRQKQKGEVTKKEAKPETVAIVPKSIVCHTHHNIILV